MNIAILLIGLVIATMANAIEEASSLPGALVIDLTSYQDGTQFVGSLYVGSQRQKMDFVFDTGSVWSWIPLETCTQCYQQDMVLFNQNESSSYGRLSDQVQMIKYGLGKTYGYQSEDQLCFNQTVCTDEDFLVLSVIQIENLDGFKGDGIIGLSPSSMNTPASRFIDALYDNGSINKKVFTFDLKNRQLTLGSSPDTLAQQNQITWNKVQNPYFWTLKLTGAKIGTRTIELHSNMAVIDSGTSYIVVPEKASVQILSYFRKSMLCDINQQKLYQCLCDQEAYDNNFPNFFIQIGTNMYKIPKESYVEQLGQKCILKLTVHQVAHGGFWVLGANFLENYQAHFDAGNLRVGLVGDTTVMVETQTTLLDVLTAIVVIISILTLFYIIYKVAVGTKSEETAEAQDDYQRASSPPTT